MKLFTSATSLPKGHPQKNQLVVFIIFFVGWFLIHSVTSQQFAFYAQPHVGMVIGFYFSFAALTYLRSQEKKETEEGKEKQITPPATDRYGYQRMILK